MGMFDFLSQKKAQKEKEGRFASHEEPLSDSGEEIPEKKALGSPRIPLFGHPAQMHENQSEIKHANHSQKLQDKHSAQSNSVHHAPLAHEHPAGGSGRAKDDVIIPAHRAAKETAKEVVARAQNNSEEYKKQLYERKTQQMRDKAMGKKTLGVCIPDHAKENFDRRKGPRNELSPFDKLRIDYEKSNAEFNREFEEISSQMASEPQEYDTDLGVEVVAPEKEEVKEVPRAKIDFDRKAALEREVRGVIASRKPFGKSEASETKSTWGKAVPSFSTKNEEYDEIEDSIEKVGEYVPKFSKTAREKFEAERAAPAEPKAFGSFTVTGVYPGGDTTIISGEVTSGKINSRMSAHSGASSVKITELKRGTETVRELYEGEHGTIFARGSVNTVRYGDTLEFG